MSQSAKDQPEHQELTPGQFVDLLRKLSELGGRPGAIAAAFSEDEALRSVKAPDTSEVARAYNLFRLLADNARWRSRWQRARAEIPSLDRDRVVADLWEAIDCHLDGSFQEKVGSKVYHRAWLFRWLGGRYDLRRARRVLGRSSLWALVPVSSCLRKARARAPTARP